MKIALYVSNRIFRKWPEDYIREFVNKAIARGHRVFQVADGDPDNERIIAECDAFVGAPGKYADIAKSYRKKVIHLLGPTLKGEGVVSPIICAGCLDKLGEQSDCFFHDEICMMEITPNDVLEEICA